MSRKISKRENQSGKRLSNLIIDKRLKKLKIKRLLDFDNSKIKGPATVKTNWLCLKCKNIFYSDLVSLTIVKSGCRVCNNKKPEITNILIDERLKNRKIKRLKNFNNKSFLNKMKTKVKWRCLHCNFVWKTTAQHITLDKSGCPNCAKTIEYSNNLIDKRLENRKIKRLADFDSKFIKGSSIVDWKCQECNFIWKTTAHSVVGSKKSGCPNCVSSRGEKIISEILQSMNVKFEIQKNKILKENSKIRVDFYLEKTNSIIEYNGEHHYRPVLYPGLSESEANFKFKKQKARDKKIRKFCKINNINYLEIDSRKLKKNNLIKLKEQLLKIIMEFINVSSSSKRKNS